jgi:hypothetical protein
VAKKQGEFTIDNLGIKLYKQVKIKPKGVYMKKMIFILLVLPILVGTVFAEKLATLTGIMKPDNIYIDDQQIYINFWCQAKLTTFSFLLSFD